MWSHCHLLSMSKVRYLMTIERICCMHGWATIGDVTFFEEFGDNSHVDASLNACREDSKCDIPTGIF